MKGYFSSLAKQSGLAFAAGNQTIRGASPGVPARISASPFHIEDIKLVDSSAPVEEGGLEREPNRKAIDGPALRGEREPLERLIDVERWGTRPSDQSTFPEATVPVGLVSKTRVLETHFTAERSARSPTPSQSSDQHKYIESLEEPARPGVVRVGEGQNHAHRDPLSESARPMAREEQPIPHDYLEGIREWLSSSTTPAEGVESGRSAERDIEPGNRSFPSLIERDHQTQSEVQEFSLSIGSISVVVEEPAQPAVPKQNKTQESGNQSVNVQSHTRDAFALTRSYFRGF